MRWPIRPYGGSPARGLARAHERASDASKHHPHRVLPHPGRPLPAGDQERATGRRTLAGSPVPRSFPFAATARDGYYLPGHEARQDVYLIAGQLAPGAQPAAAIGAYLAEFSGQEVHLTAEPARPLGGLVKCWEAGGFTFCMWADRGTYGVLDYRPPLGLDTLLIRHLAGLVPRFRQAMERVTR